MAGYPYYPQQPMINNPYGQIQPYQDRLAQLQSNYQQTMPYGQIQMQQLQPIPQSPMLQGQMVDGIDTVKAKDVDMSGNPVYYPKTDGTEIYRKQLQSDGRSKIFVYRLVNPEEEQKSSQEEKQIDIEAGKFGGSYYLEASTLFRDQATGNDYPAEFIIPNCKVQSNFTFTMAPTGDPSTFTFTMDAFPDYTKFDKTKKVIAALQIVEDSDTFGKIVAAEG